MTYNYSEVPNWMQPAVPQNQGFSAYGQDVMPRSDMSASSTYYGSPAPVSPTNSNSSSFYGTASTVSPPQENYMNYYSSPNNHGNSLKDNNHYASPALSPGDWNQPSPNGPSPTQHPHYSYASPNSVYSSDGQGTPTSTRSEPFTYSSAKLDLPRNLGQGSVDKSELDIGREKVAGAKALYLLQETWSERQYKAKQSPEVQRPISGATKATGQSSTQVSGNRQATTQNSGAATRNYNQRRLLPASKEKLATSTRRKKVPTEEEDFENITDYKCQLDIDRQKSAQKKALKLLSYF